MLGRMFHPEKSQGNRDQAGAQAAGQPPGVTGHPEQKRAQAPGHNVHHHNKIRRVQNTLPGFGQYLWDFLPALAHGI